jgi:N4-gp56 family major capsid protein
VKSGNLFGIKILSTTTVPTVTIEGGVKVQLGVIIGRDAYGVVDVDGSSKPEMIVKPHGSSGASDPLNQRATSAWKAMLAAKRLNELAMVRLETGTSLLA